MDTLTQALLGGAVATVVAGRQANRRIMLMGAVLATLPDLDVFFAYDHPLDAMTQHRSWTHSWIVQTLLAPLMAWAIWRWQQSLNRWLWFWIVWWVWVTHSALDALTVYGTQLFWPWMPPPVAIGSVFIIDIFYTLPLLAGCLWMLMQANVQAARRAISWSLVVSSAYLLWSLLAQSHVRHAVINHLAAHEIPAQQILVSPTFSNTLLWRILVMDSEHYHEGFFSLLQPEGFTLTGFARGQEWRNTLEPLPSFQQFEWFNHGFNRVVRVEDNLVVSDLRMGMEPSYFFEFILAEWRDESWQVVTPSRYRSASSTAFRQRLDHLRQKLSDTSLNRD